MRRRVMYVRLFAIALSALAISCSTNQVTLNDDTLPSSKAEEVYAAMIERSLVSLGNTERFVKAVEKARRGDPVVIAFIGGSITQGYSAKPEGSYAAGFVEAFKAAYAPEGGKNVSYVNGGMGGTPSTVGMVRYKREILDKASSPPDIVVVEFAVNDGDDPTGGASYESLVRGILLEPQAPAVILLFSVFRSHWNLQERLATVGEAYSLPMVSIRDAVVPELETGRISHDEFFRDQYHPSEYGFKIMADCLSHFAAKAVSSPRIGAEAALPEKAVIGAQFVGIRMIDRADPPEGGSVDAGAFSGSDMLLSKYGYGLSAKPTFPNNWHREGQGDAPFVLSLECKNLVVLYKKSADPAFGSAELFVDGVMKGRLASFDQAGWNNPWTFVAIDEAESKPRRVEIKMAPGDEAKKFTILAFGATR